MRTDLCVLMGKYRRLSELLQQKKEDVFICTFADIEKTLDFPLPDFAQDRRWWGNDATHVQGRAWLAVGWRVSVVDWDKKEVTFTRFKKVNPPPTESTKERALKAMSEFFDETLMPQRLGGIPREFDMVSEDKTIVGNFKSLSGVGGRKKPTAKHPLISEQVWLLSKTDADILFLAFDKDREVPMSWLRTYGGIENEVIFFFITDEGEVELLELDTDLEESPTTQVPIPAQISPSNEVPAKQDVPPIAKVSVEVERKEVPARVQGLSKCIHDWGFVGLIQRLGYATPGYRCKKCGLETEADGEGNPKLV